jgi:hypothetical protein
VTTSATSRLSIADVRPPPKGSRIVPSLAIDSAAQARSGLLFLSCRRLSLFTLLPISRRASLRKFPFPRRVARMARNNIDKKGN